MVQDPKEWKNQSFTVTVYNTLGSKHYDEENQFIIEAVNVLKPYQRAYLNLKSLENLRGELLYEYIDEEV